MSDNDWRCQSWNNNFVLCIKVIVKGCQCQSLNNNFVFHVEVIGSAVLVLERQLFVDY